MKRRTLLQAGGQVPLLSDATLARAVAQSGLPVRRGPDRVSRPEACPVRTARRGGLCPCNVGSRC